MNLRVIDAGVLVEKDDGAVRDAFALARSPLVIVQVDDSGHTADHAEDVYVCDATVADAEVTLPAVPVPGSRFRLYKVDASGNAATFLPGAGDTINGTASTIVQNGSVEVISISVNIWQASAF